MVRYIFSKAAFLTLLCCYVLLQVHGQSRCDSIPWSENHSLKWRNFKARPDKASSMNAISNVNINYWYTTVGKVANFHFTCFFSPCNSWIRENPTGNIIEHEQVHFNLAEYHKRLLAEKVSNGWFTRKDLDNSIDSIGKLVNRQRILMDELYDMETKHSLNHEKQSEWSKKLQQLLMELKEYRRADYLIALH